VYSRQCLDETDLQAVTSVLTSDYLTQGPITEAFESAIASYTGSEHAIAVNSATSGLHLALLACGVRDGDEVWTTPNTFVATANAARMCGANVQFVDIDPETLNLSPDALMVALDIAQKSNRLPRAIIFVHFGGNPTGFLEVAQIAASFDIDLIEDASHALGSKILGQPVGNCTYSKATIFSLHAVKPITSGEGGVVTTNDPSLADQIRLLRSHGVTREPNSFRQSSPNAIKPKWYYEQIALGFNYRMSDIHAALGLSQTNKIDKFANHRRELASAYEEYFTDTAIETQYHNHDVESARHLFVIKCPSAGMRDRLTHRFDSIGIGYNFHYIPVYRHPYYSAVGLDYRDFKNVEDYYSRGLTLPLHAFLTKDDVEEISSNIKSAISSRLRNID
jgi:UDP-4-amino-4,6-dideoxy-N-acetyl-beta-L-altrosamine transaminase